MRPEEAKYIGSVLSRLSVDEISPVLNLGSSTASFENERPHIETFVFAPLRERGVRIVNIDLKDGAGVDIVGNIYDAETQHRARSVNANLLICCNILEHLTDPGEFARICASLLAPAGRILVTVPYSYPYHLDPIDTYFRPSPAEIAALFDSLQPVEQKVITDSTYWQDLMAQNSPSQLVRQFASHGIKLFLPFGDFERWKARFHRYLWLFRPYKISCVLLERKLAAS